MFLLKNIFNRIINKKLNCLLKSFIKKNHTDPYSRDFYNKPLYQLKNKAEKIYLMFFEKQKIINF